MWTTWTKAGWTLLTIGALLTVLTSMRYLTLNPEVYFPSQRATYEAHTLGLIVHIAAMLIAATLGPFQFLRSFRNRHLQLHRVLGKIYLVAAMIGALGGIYMSLYSRSDAASGIGFALLGIGVLITTGMAFIRIREGRVQEHREWMTRSYALIFGAVTLRIYLPLLQIGLSEYTAFAITGWLSWIPNLLVAEWLIRQRQRVAPERDFVPA